MIRFSQRRVLFLAIFTIAVSAQSWSQEIVLRANGDSIRINENGTWEKIESQILVAEKPAPIIGNVKVSTTTDAMSGSVRHVTETWRYIGKNEVNGKLSAEMYCIDGLWAVGILITSDLGCLSEYSGKMQVKLEDDTIIEMAQISNTECDDIATAKYIVVDRDMTKSDSEALLNAEVSANIQKLSTMNWKLIRVHGTDYWSDFFPNSSSVENPEQFFMQHIGAVSLVQE